MLPYGQVLISHFGWLHALLVLAACSFLMVPLASALAGGHTGDTPQFLRLSLKQALHEVATHRGFWCLTVAFLVCGFQTIFIMVHLPAYLLDSGMSAMQGMIALAIVGFFNIVGSYVAGLLGGRFSKKFLLSWMYGIRAATITAYILLPLTAASTWIFAAVMGLTWLGTVPLTNGLVAQIFGVQYLSTLFSIAFLGHQVGSFAGAWYGGFVYDATGSYMTVWYVAIGLGVLASVLCLPIDERSMAAVAVRKARA
jgi:predicted MFS family arabinose efflux permease